MKSALTLKLEAAQIEADTTVKQAQQYIGAKALRVSAMATSHLIGEAVTLSTAADNAPAPTPPAV